jgi:hypothetical protein
VIKALEYRSNRFDGVSCCTKNETLGVIMERIVNKEVHRLVVVDDNENKKVIGIISLSDILTYIVLKQASTSPTPQLSHENKASSLAQAFGQTRLSSSIEHVIMNNSEINGSTMSVNDKSSDSRTSSPLTATTNQPQMSNLDQQAIFEDDPMDIAEPSVK